jgi:hypothetical protein
VNDFSYCLGGEDPSVRKLEYEKTLDGKKRGSSFSSISEHGGEDQNPPFAMLV